MGVIEHCPTCGATVRVVSGDEGPAHYEPITAIDELAREVAPLSYQLREAIEQRAALLDALDGIVRAAIEHGVNDQVAEALLGYADKIVARRIREKP